MGVPAASGCRWRAVPCGKSSRPSSSSCRAANPGIGCCGCLAIRSNRSDWRAMTRPDSRGASKCRASSNRRPTTDSPWGATPSSSPGDSPASSASSSACAVRCAAHPRRAYSDWTTHCATPATSWCSPAPSMRHGRPCWSRRWHCSGRCAIRCSCCTPSTARPRCCSPRRSTGMCTSSPGWAGCAGSVRRASGRSCCCSTRSRC